MRALSTGGGTYRINSVYYLNLNVGIQKKTKAKRIQGTDPYFLQSSIIFFCTGCSESKVSHYFINNPKIARHICVVLFSFCNQE